MSTVETKTNTETKVNEDQKETKINTETKVDEDQKSPMLLLHFDVNKTIICRSDLFCTTFTATSQHDQTYNTNQHNSDPVGGKSMDDMVNSLLTECVWGYTTTTTTTTTASVENLNWVCVSTEPSMDPPSVTDHKQLVTFSDFLENQRYVSKKGKDKETLAYNKNQKTVRTKIKSSFTTPDGLGSTKHSN